MLSMLNPINALSNWRSGGSTPQKPAPLIQNPQIKPPINSEDDKNSDLLNCVQQVKKNAIQASCAIEAILHNPLQTAAMSTQILSAVGLILGGVTGFYTMGTSVAVGSVVNIGAAALGLRELFNRYKGDGETTRTILDNLQFTNGCAKQIGGCNTKVVEDLDRKLFTLENELLELDQLIDENDRISIQNLQNLSSNVHNLRKQFLAQRDNLLELKAELSAYRKKMVEAEEFTSYAQYNAMGICGIVERLQKSSDSANKKDIIDLKEFCDKLVPSLENLEYVLKNSNAMVSNFQKRMEGVCITHKSNLEILDLLKKEIYTQLKASKLKDKNNVLKQKIHSMQQILSDCRDKAALLHRGIGIQNALFDEIDVLAEKAKQSARRERINGIVLGATCGWFAGATTVGLACSAAVIIPSYIYSKTIGDKVSDTVHDRILRSEPINTDWRPSYKGDEQDFKFEVKPEKSTGILNRAFNKASKTQYTVRGVIGNKLEIDIKVNTNALFPIAVSDIKYLTSAIKNALKQGDVTPEDAKKFLDDLNQVKLNPDSNSVNLFSKAVLDAIKYEIDFLTQKRNEKLSKTSNSLIEDKKKIIIPTIVENYLITSVC